MHDNARQFLLLLLIASLGLLGWVYRETYATIVLTWLNNTTFSHGVLIVPISLWMMWRKRSELAKFDLKPSWRGAAVLAVCAASWVVARGAGVLVLEQMAAVGMIFGTVLTVLGWPATRTLLFPLAFLFFAVPFGDELLPWLMQVTADVATRILQWSGVPVMRSHMYISIPSGDFEVARACSGLNYVVTGIVLGVLYAYLTYTSWLKRAICIAAFLVVPILANGLRVYITILVSHWTEMRFGPGTEHVTFGRIFFIAIMVLMFWFGRRWQDESTPRAHLVPPSGDGRGGVVSGIEWLSVPAALAIVLAAPPYFSASVTGARARLAAAEQLIVLPVGAGWEGPLEHDLAWRPLYFGGLAERQGRYWSIASAPVDVFVAVYGLGASVGAEMISYNNLLFAKQRESLPQEERREVGLPNGAALEVLELVVSDPKSATLVWYWYMVGDRSALGAFSVKALEAQAFLTRSTDSERIITLATPLDATARDRLTAFVSAHATCVRSGFSAEGCD